MSDFTLEMLDLLCDFTLEMLAFVCDFTLTLGITLDYTHGITSDFQLNVLPSKLKLHP